VDNYFNYFTEIEEHFQKRRSGTLLLSTLDWALIETWKDAGIPLQAVLRGIETAFDKYEQRPSKTQKVNSLAYCAQAVLAAAEEMKEAAVGVATEVSAETERGFGTNEIAAFLTRNAELLERAPLPEKPGISAISVARETAATLKEIAENVAKRQTVPGLESLERQLTLLEDRLFAILLAVTPDDQVLLVRAEADRELAPYRRKMPVAQIDLLQKQFVHKRLLEKHGLPRLSLFYM
jgi:hypothetical protein